MRRRSLGIAIAGLIVAGVAKNPFDYGFHVITYFLFDVRVTDLLTDRYATVA